jgi:4-amino-4-deoxy-L-arabinose transferase-like glycosyltransferase
VYRHSQPFWYFVPIVLVALLPWTVLCLSGLARAIGEWRASRSTQALVLWAVLPVIFFSFSGSKLPGYILPTVPAFGMLAANYLRGNLLAGKRVNNLLLLAHALASGAMLSAVLLAPNRVLRIRPPQQAIVLAGCGAVAVLCVIVLIVRRAGWRSLRVITLAPVLLGLVFVIRFAAPMLDATFSARPVARELARLEPQKGPVAIFNAPREVEYGLGFYLNQPVPRYDRDTIPASAHVVITRLSPQDQRRVPVLAELQARLPGRQIVTLGEFAPQQLGFYWVGSAPEGSK